MVDRVPCELPTEYQQAYSHCQQWNLVDLIESDAGKRLLEEYDKIVRSTIQPSYTLQRYDSELLQLLFYDREDSTLSKRLEKFSCKFQKLVSSCQNCREALRILCRAMVVSAKRFHLIRPMMPSDETSMITV